MAAPADVRPIIIRRARKSAVQHHGGAWKVAYADFVTAMMAFFMLLWLISNPDKQQLKGLAEYFSPNANATPTVASRTDGAAMSGSGKQPVRDRSESAASGQPAIQAASGGSARGGTAEVPDTSMRVLAQEMRVAIDSVPDDAQDRQNVRIEQDRTGLRISLMDTANRSMFRGGTAVLNDYARQMLERVAAKLVRSGAQIAIEGHTDGSGGQSEANWRLSGERALAALGAMQGAGLSSNRFAEIVAKAGTEPVYPDQPERPENRRITVVVLGENPALPSDSSFKF